MHLKDLDQNRWKEIHRKGRQVPRRKKQLDIPNWSKLFTVVNCEYWYLGQVWKFPTVNSWDGNSQLFTSLEISEWSQFGWKFQTVRQFGNFRVVTVGMEIPNCSPVWKFPSVHSSDLLSLQNAIKN